MADWTVEEARAYLPRLRRLVEVLRSAARTSARASGNGHRTGVGTEGGQAATDDTPGPSDSSETLRPADALAEIRQRGIVLRDLDKGIIDFPSRHPGGRQVLLCWQIDEPELEWWHLPEDGFAGRRPLPLPPEI